MKKEKILTKTLSAVLVSSCILGSLPAVANASTLTDISGHWAESQITEALEKGVVTGYLDETFRPNEGIKMSECLVQVVRSSEKLEADMVENPDVQHWANLFYQSAMVNNIIPSSLTVEDLDKDVTREEIAYMIYQTLLLEGESHEAYPKENIRDFDKIGAEFQESVLGCYALGIVIGSDTDGNLSSYAPQATFTRAETCVAILNVLKDPADRHQPDFTPVGGNSAEEGENQLKTGEYALTVNYELYTEDDALEGEGGTVFLSHSSANEGDVVTVTVIPDNNNFFMASYSFYPNQKEEETSGNGNYNGGGGLAAGDIRQFDANNQATFTMPNADTNVFVGFFLNDEE